MKFGGAEAYIPSQPARREQVPTAYPLSEAEASTSSIAKTQQLIDVVVYG